MGIKEYNHDQVKAIRKFISDNGGNFEDDTNESSFRLELEWAETHSQKFREDWIKKNGDAVSC